MDHADDIKRSLDLHVFPRIGKVRARHVIEALTPIAAKGSLETVKRLAQRVNEVMVYAVNTDLIPANLVQVLAKLLPLPRKNTCSP